MPGNAAATRLNVSCHTLWAGTAFALSLIVTRILPRALAHSTTAQIHALRVLSKDHEVDRRTVGRSDSRTVRAKNPQVRMQQLHRPEVDVEIEPQPEPQEDVARVLIPGHARVSEGPEEDRVHVVLEMTERVVRQSLPCLEIVIGGIREALELEPEAVFRGGALEHRDRRLDDLRPDAVSPNDSDWVGVHSPTVRQSDGPTVIRSPSRARSRRSSASRRPLHCHTRDSAARPTAAGRTGGRSSPSAPRGAFRRNRDTGAGTRSAPRARTQIPIGGSLRRLLRPLPLPSPPPVSRAPGRRATARGAARTPGRRAGSARRRAGSGSGSRRGTGGTARDRD